MASAQEPGVIKMYILKPNGMRIPIFTMRTEEAAPGGAPDHAVSANQEKWRYWPVGGPIINHGDRLLINVKLDASDGIDVSDCVFSIPFKRSDGGIDIITDADVTMTDITPPAAAETQLAYYDFVGGPRKFGGATIFMAIEDDTA